MNIRSNRASGPRRRRLAWPAVVCAAALCIGACSHEPGGDGAKAPEELVSGRRLQYLVATPAAVMQDLSTATKPDAQPIAADERLQKQVKKMMRAVGLTVIDDPMNAHDVEVRLAVQVNPAGRLARGMGAMQLNTGGRVITQWRTDEHVEPANEFDVAVARDLVQRLARSQGVAKYADSVYGPYTRPVRETVGRRDYGNVHGGTPPLEQVQAAEGSSTRSTETAMVLGQTAPERSSEAIEAAKQHADKGNALYSSKDFKGAYVEFEEAFLQTQDAPAVYAMAECQRNLGNTVDALAFYRDYLRRAPEGPMAGEARARAGELDRAGSK
jgi:TolA-binding protein